MNALSHAESRSVQRNNATGNRLLDVLSPSAFARLRAHLQPCVMHSGETIHNPGHAAEYVYFPICGVISVVATMSNGASVEIAMIGREGMFSISAILGDAYLLQSAIVRLPGSGLRVKRFLFQQQSKADPAMQAMLLLYAQATLSAVAQSAACNRLHKLQQRCARCLLTAHDRAEHDTFPMTHEILALMLGVRRAGVTIAAQALQRDGLITYNHGAMTLHDRDGLEASSCECYRAIQDEFERLMGA
jgi:CRP-like cAMP-binding protein